MRKIVKIAMIILMCCALFTACEDKTMNNHEESARVYSFNGENDQFEISNGVIVLSSMEDVFYGGNLEEKQDYFSDVAAYSMTFYIMSGDEKKIVLSNGVEDTTGGTVNISGFTGKVSGDDIIIGTKTDILKDNLYFELKTSDLNGDENVHQLQLSLTEITGSTEK